MKIASYTNALGPLRQSAPEEKSSICRQLAAAAFLTLLTCASASAERYSQPSHSDTHRSTHHHADNRYRENNHRENAHHRESNYNRSDYHHAGYHDRANDRYNDRYDDALLYPLLAASVPVVQPIMPSVRVVSTAAVYDYQVLPTETADLQMPRTVTVDLPETRSSFPASTQLTMRRSENISDAGLSPEATDLLQSLTRSAAVADAKLTLTTYDRHNRKTVLSDKLSHLEGAAQTFQENRHGNLVLSLHLSRNSRITADDLARMTGATMQLSLAVLDDYGKTLRTVTGTARVASNAHSEAQLELDRQLSDALQRARMTSSAPKSRQR